MVSTHPPGGTGPDDLGAYLQAAGLRRDEPGVAQLLSALAAPPSRAELSGEQAALAMFRANLAASPDARTLRDASPTPDAALAPSAMPSPDAVRSPERPRGRARSAGRRWRIGLAAAGALTVVGTVSAAYAAALPAPVQHLAHQVLGFAGVPDSEHLGAGPGSAQHRHPGASSSAPASRSGGGAAGPTPSQPGSGPSVSPSPHPTRSSGAPAPPPAQLSIAAGQHEIAAGGTAVLVARVSQGGHAASGMTVRLFERTAGQLSWRVVGTAATSASGQATVRVSGLASNASFRFTADGRISQPVTVTVVPAVTLTTVSQPGAHHRTALLAASPYARAGDVVVLQVQVNGTWRDVRAGRLGGNHERLFLVTTRLFAGRAMRAALLPTRTHAGSVSNTVTLPSG